ncbi:hypothetical protein LINGRAHAP2_LOCUS29062 [Linum grandiflorum]
MDQQQEIEESSLQALRSVSVAIESSEVKNVQISDMQWLDQWSPCRPLQALPSRTSDQREWAFLVRVMDRKEKYWKNEMSFFTGKLN